jgi:RND family efflux transporter MFP subunit
MISAVRTGAVFLMFRLHQTLIVAVAVALSACHDTSAPAPAKKTPDPINVTVTPVAPASWDRTVSIIGTLFPKDEATVAAEVEAMVQKTSVEFGDRVTAGQVMAVLDAATYQADLQRELGAVARAQANLTNAMQVMKRDTELQKTGAVAASDIDAARAQVAQWEAEVKAAEAAMSMAQLNIKRSQIKAPFDGAIAQRKVTQGDFVKIASPLFTVVNDKVLKFIFEVPEKFASQVKKDLAIEFSVDNFPGEKFAGSVYLISPVVNAATRALNVGALVQNPDLKLKASTFARGRLILENGVPVNVVPQEAVVTFAGVTKVFVADGSIARSRTVKAGRVQNGKQEIIDGMKPGENVITSGQGRLVEGAAIAIQSGAKS